MATEIALDHVPPLAKPRSRREADSPLKLIGQILSPLASLKLTLVLLAMGIFLVFVGTLAQAQAGMWEAVSRYFWSWGTWVELQVFFPKPWFPVWHENFEPWMGFPFPGGKTIGVAMMINLLAAHTLRFKIQTKGSRLALGIGVLTLGIVLTTLIVALGDFRQGLREEPLVSWETTAILTLVGATVSSLALLGSGLRFALRAASGNQGATAGSSSSGLGGTAGSPSSVTSSQRQDWVLAGLCGAGGLVTIVGCILLIMFFNDISALRILWQLIQGTVAGVVLLGGCWLLFDKRGGIVLLHGGIGLMMVSQLFVSLWAVEEQMNITEGATAVYAQDIRNVELAIVQSSDDEETHIVVPGAKLSRAATARESQRVISHDKLPFDIRVEKFFANAELADPKEAKSNLATAGIGLQQLAEPKATSAGASSDANVDFPATYVTLLDKKTGDKIGTYLASVQIALANFTDQIRVGDQSYDLSLRFVRDYKPYQVTALDVRKEDYPGSSTARKFESDVVITDPRFGMKREVTIFMNNPFRYLGETFYQSGYRVDPMSRKEETTFQVVRNSGWMIPYVACMIVAVGMLYQFVQTLMNYVLKDAQSRALAANAVTAAVAEEKKGKGKGRREEAHTTITPSWSSWFVPSPVAVGTIALSLAVIALGLYWPKPKIAAKEGEGKFDLYAFGKLPVVAGGRAKPLDSLARESLLGMSNRTTYKTFYYLDENGTEVPLKTAEDVEEAKASDHKVKSRTHSATEWLINTIARPEEAEHYQVIRIENPEVISALKLPQDREGMRYSMAELRQSAKEYDEQLEQVRKKDKDARTVYDQKLLELDSRLQKQMRISSAFRPIPLPKLENVDKNDPKTMDEVIGMFQMIREWNGRMQEIQPPLAIPVTDESLAKLMGPEKWQPYSIAVMLADAKMKMAQAGLAEKSAVDLPTASLESIFTAYAEDKPETFNDNVRKYAKWLDEESPPLDAKGDHRYRASGVAAEAYFNHVAPFGWTQGILLYLLAIVVSLLGLMFYRRSLGSAAFWMLAIVFAMHTIALGMRMYISGRPPVTNLYSSAVFIGWAGVFCGLVLEGIFRIGVGNLIAALCGTGGLMIAHMLSFEGDTIGVEVAVLDTQFWLSTHVVSITLGYALTFVAGFIGAIYIVLGLVSPLVDRNLGKDLARIIYGIVCFALFFSFVGTVLGGLWADDSWGRFWGWDPKENGALIIVLWNAFILHATWDKLAKERGLAVLAVLGNVVTGWSWFGTNQLGIGLHSYGFTSGVLMALAGWTLLNLVIFAIGLLPKSFWWSFRNREMSPQAA